MLSSQVARIPFAFQKNWGLLSCTYLSLFAGSRPANSGKVLPIPTLPALAEELFAAVQLGEASRLNHS